MISIRPVSFADILRAPNAAELLAEYGAECSIPEIGPINPQADIYENLETAGVMQCFGVFHNFDLIGFANVLINVFPHYGRKVATIESLFVAREHRKSEAGIMLMDIIDKHAQDAGCVGILYSAPFGGRLERMLTLRSRFRRTNSVFYRSL